LEERSALACGAALIFSMLGRAEVGSPGIHPVPCADQAWAYDNPGFEAASFGRYDGGLYRIEVPDTWNGDLVLWAHGFVDNKSGGQECARTVRRDHSI
jgi:hypothetical protein